MRVAKYLFFVLVCLTLFTLTHIALADDNGASLRGRAFIPVATEEGKITERFFSCAPIEVVDLTTGKVVAEDETKVNGRYSVLVDIPGSYLLRIGKGNRVLLVAIPRVREERTYHLGLTSARSTALTLVLLNLSSGQKDPASIITYKAPLVLRSEHFKDLEKLVRKTLALGQDLFGDPEIQRLVAVIASPLRD
ncbi:MAG: hypothetical protein ACP5Q4_09655 [Candidatus Caldatribacteriaceae bacterium]